MNASNTWMRQVIWTNKMTSAPLQLQDWMMLFWNRIRRRPLGIMIKLVVSSFVFGKCNGKNYPIVKKWSSKLFFGLVVSSFFLKVKWENIICPMVTSIRSKFFLYFAFQSFISPSESGSYSFLFVSFSWFERHLHKEWKGRMESILYLAELKMGRIDKAVNKGLS